MLTREGRPAGIPFGEWLTECRRRASMKVERVPLERLDEWSFEQETGNLRHSSGRFFTVEGLEVHVPDGPVPRWTQPIINQPETGILGLLVKTFDGVPHFLMQAKAEPGNAGGVQLSPTVQATRSNYTKVHRGRDVPYLEYFRDPALRRVLVDVRQSEQGSAFHRKRNRNMVVEARGPVRLLPGFRWMTLGELFRLLGDDDLVNMDVRTVLACLPYTDPFPASLFSAGGDGFAGALVRSCAGPGEGVHSMTDVLSWITEMRSSADVRSRLIGLGQVDGWRRVDGRITHETERFFDVIGVSVTAAGREVGAWMQPMIAPHGTGIAAFLVKRIDGVLHVLAQARAEAGFADTVELGPTVQCRPSSYEVLPDAARPPFLDEVLRAEPDRIRFEALLSEEGGRFYHARNRYLIIETDLDPGPGHPGYRWVTLRQMSALLRHSHYLNVEARTLVTCLFSLIGRDGIDAIP